jgi:hypothetical protein
MIYLGHKERFVKRLIIQDHTDAIECIVWLGDEHRYEELKVRPLSFTKH